jgi:hypothetical protein
MTIVRQAGKHSFRRHGGPTPVSRGLKLRCRSHISVCLFSHFGAIQFLLFPSARHFLFQPGGAGVAAGPSWSFFFFFSSSTFFFLNAIIVFLFMNFVTVDITILPKKNITETFYVYYLKNVMEMKIAFR